MSKNLFIVKYKACSSNNALYDELANLVCAAFLPYGLLSTFETRGMVEDIQIFETVDSDVTFNITIVKKSMIPAVLSVLEHEFTTLKMLGVENVSDDIKQLGTITSLYSLVSLYRDKFINDTHSVLSIG